MQKLKYIKEVEKSLSDGIVCLTQPNGEERYNFCFLSFNQHFTSSTTPLNILENKGMELDTKILAGFYGEAFSIASFTKPNYSDYLKEVTFEDVIVDFSGELIAIDGFEPISLVEVKELDEYPFVLRIENDDHFGESAELISVNKNGRDKNDLWVVSNHSKEILTNLFTEFESYILLSETAGPIYLSKEKYNLIKECGGMDFSILGVEEGSNYVVMPSLTIMLGDAVIEHIILDTREKTPDYHYSNSNEPVYDDFDDGFDSGFDDDFDELSKQDLSSTHSNIETAEVVEELSDTVGEADWVREMEMEADWDDEISLNEDESDDWDEEIELNEEDK